MIAPRPARPRLPYIDWARGIAVLIMIESHTADAWTRAASKTTVAFRNAAVLGGFAAPLFLWLAGVAAVLVATRVAREDNRAAAVEMLCRRACEIFILAFLFRLQSFVLATGSHPIKLFRVDILNIMGPALAAVAIIWGLSRTTTGVVASFAGAATALALLTPIVRASTSVDVLPTVLQWYVRPAGDYTTFTLLPWAGFVFAGGACGALIAAVTEQRRVGQLQMVFGACGAALVAAGFAAAARPSIYRASSFWTSSPTWFAIRVGVLMMGLAAVYACARVAGRFGIRGGPLARLGRSSLFVYWIHVELVYGFATKPLHGQLPLWGTAIGFGICALTMYGAMEVRDRLVAAWRGRIHHLLAPSTALVE